MLLLLAARSVAAQALPVEVQAVDLQAGDDSAAVVLRTEAAVEWSIETRTKELVVFLPRTVPGPEALDRSSRAGLVSLVEVGFAVPEGVPTTRITIHARRSFEHQISRSRDGVTIRLQAGSAQGQSPQSPGNTVRREAPAADAGEIEAARREIAQLKQRVADLHSDRLELREELASAERRLADAKAPSPELEAQNRQLTAALEREKAKEAEATRRAGRLEARLKQAESDLAAAQSSNRTPELERRLNAVTAELEREKSGQMVARQQAARLNARVTELQGELEAARDSDTELVLGRRVDALTSELEAASAALAASRQAASRSSARVAELEGELATARASDRVARLNQQVEALKADLTDEKNRRSASASEAERLSLKVQQLEAELGTARSALESSVATDELARRQAQLESQLDRSRQAESTLRSWLAQAPDVLGAKTLVVGERSSCLPLKPEPDAASADLTCVDVGSQLTALSFRPDWIRVRSAGGREGWVPSVAVAPAAAGESLQTARDLRSERAKVAELDRQISELQASVAGYEARSAESDAQARAARELTASLERERQARETAEASLAAARAEIVELERDAGAANRMEMAEESSRRAESAQERLRALLAEANLGRPIVSAAADPCLSIRSGPGTEFDRIDCIAPGSVLTIRDAQEDWFAVEAPGVEGRGWVAADFIEPATKDEVAATQSSLEAERRDLEERLAVARTELDEAQRLGAGAAAQISELERRAEEREERLATVTAELASARSDLDSARSALEAESRDLSVRVAAVEGERDALGAELEALRSQREAERRDALGPLRVTGVVVKPDVDPCLSLRREPRLDSESLDCLEPGTRASALAMAGEWLELRLDDGRRGWSSGGFLEPVDEEDLRRALEQVASLQTAMASEKEAHALEIVGLEDGARAARAELESTVAARERAITDLEARLAASQATATQLDTAAQERDQAAQRIRELTQELTASESERSREQSEASGRVEQLTEELAASESERSRERDEAASAQIAWSRELQEAKEEIARLGSLASEAGTVPILQADVEKLRDELELAKSRGESLEAELSADRRELEARADRIAALEEQAASAEANTAERLDLESRLEAAETGRAAIEVLNKDLMAELQRVAEESRNKAQVARELRMVRADLAAAESKAKALEEQIAADRSKTQTRAADRARVDELTEERDRLAQDLAASRDRLGELETANRALADVGSSLRKAEGELTQARARNEDLERRLAALEAERVASRTVAVAESSPVAAPPTTPETEPVGASAVEELPVPPVPADLEAFARAWARAWSQQRVSDYLSFYAASFRPANGMSRSDWEAQRRDRLTRPEFIEVSVSGFSTSIDGVDRATVSFDQAYRSNTFEDRVTKTLELVREGDLWKIDGETSSP